MPREHYSSRQIAAHIAQGYLDNNEYPASVEAISRKLTGRLPEVRDRRACYQKLGSLLYCVGDMKQSCREAAISTETGENGRTEKKIRQAARRVREIGMILTEIRDTEPDEYECSCRPFVEEWSRIKFDRGGNILSALEKGQSETSAGKKEDTPAKENKAPAVSL